MFRHHSGADSFPGGLPVGGGHLKRAGSEVEPLLERAGILKHLGAVVFGDDVTRHKPDPEPYLLAASAPESKPPASGGRF